MLAYVVRKKFVNSLGGGVDMKTLRKEMSYHVYDMAELEFYSQAVLR